MAKSSTTSPSTIKSWMRSQVAQGGYRDSGNEPEYTQLAESAAAQFDCFERLNDDQNLIWDWAVSAFGA